MCVGMPLALLQIPLILANVVQDYTLEFSGKPSFRPILGSSLTPADKTIMAAVKRRVGANG